MVKYSKKKSLKQLEYKARYNPDDITDFDAFLWLMHQAEKTEQKKLKER